MDYENRSLPLYDTQTNTRFTDALIYEIIYPAKENAARQDRYDGVEGDFTTAESEVHYDGKRISYDFFKEKDDDIIIIGSTIHTRVSDLTHEGAFLIESEIQQSSLGDEFKDKYRGAVMALRTVAEIEVFTRRSFKIDMRDGFNEVRVQTELGYAVDGCEVARPYIETMGIEPFELDYERETIFETDELEEITRALLAMELINERHVRKFLERGF